MPIHEFNCKSCAHIFEYLCLRSDEKDNVLCPSCGQGEAELLFSTFFSRGSTTKRGSAAIPSSSCSSSGGFS